MMDHYILRQMGGKPTAIGYHGKTAIEFSVDSANSGATNTKLNKGRKPCTSNPLSSLLSQLLACQLALKAIQSVQSLAQVPVWSQQKFWALTAQAQFWPVQPQACSVTTWAFAAQPHGKSCAPAGASGHYYRRRGNTPAAFLRFGGKV